MPDIVGVVDAQEQNSYYRISLVSPRHDCLIWAWTPDDFAMSLTENWNFIVGGGSPVMTAMFGLLSGGLAPTNQILTAQVWSGGTPIRFNLPLRFVAKSNALNEVLKPVKYLMKMALPVASGFFLRPPGPSINSKLTNLGATDNGDRITLTIGNYLRLTDIYIEGVEVNFKGKLNSDGEPMEAMCTLRCATLYAPVASDIDRYIGQNLGRKS